MDISLPPNFLIPTECHAVLAFKEKGKHLPQGGIMEVKRNVDSTEIEHPIIDRLKLTSIYKLDLSYGGTFDHLDELIYDTQVLGKGPYQSLYISEKSNGQFVKRKHPNQLMKPWRVWSINVSNKLK